MSTELNFIPTLKFRLDNLHKQLLEQVEKENTPYVRCKISTFDSAREKYENDSSLSNNERYTSIIKAIKDIKKADFIGPSECTLGNTCKLWRHGKCLDFHTELFVKKVDCKNWIADGKCAYGDNCIFIHSPDKMGSVKEPEVKPIPKPVVKTKLKSEVKPAVKSEVKTKLNPEVKPEVKPVSVSQTLNDELRDKALKASDKLTEAKLNLNTAMAYLEYKNTKLKDAKFELSFAQDFYNQTMMAQVSTLTNFSVSSTKETFAVKDAEISLQRCKNIVDKCQAAVNLVNTKIEKYKFDVMLAQRESNLIDARLENLLNNDTSSLVKSNKKEMTEDELEYARYEEDICKLLDTR